MLKVKKRWVKIMKLAKISILFCFLIIISSCSNHVSTAPKAKTYLTLKQAISLSYSYIKKRDSSPSLLFVSSVDDKKNTGSLGEKKYWNVIYKLSDENKDFFIFIEGNKIVQGKKILHQEDPEINVANLNYDSKDIAKIAIKKYKLKPGTGKENPVFTGYHFKLLKDGNFTFLGISGFNENKKFSEIYFNPKTGKYLGDMEK
jgi:hypothetical protein